VPTSHTSFLAPRLSDLQATHTHTHSMSSSNGRRLVSSATTQVARRPDGRLGAKAGTAPGGRDRLGGGSATPTPAPATPGTPATTPHLAWGADEAAPVPEPASEVEQQQQHPSKKTAPARGGGRVLLLALAYLLGLGSGAAAAGVAGRVLGCVCGGRAGAGWGDEGGLFA